MNTAYPRDMIGYGRTPPDPKWPDGANVAVQFVLNYEEGAENTILHGDAASESLLTVIEILPHALDLLAGKTVHDDAHPPRDE